MNKFILRFILPFLFTSVIISCTNDTRIPLYEDIDQTEKSNKSKAFKLELQAFSTFPPEIDGCTCYFAKDSVAFNKNNFIYMDDFGDLSVVKINGELVYLNRLKTIEQKDFTVIQYYKNDDYELTLTIHEGEASGDESWFNHGTIKLTKINGESITHSFYGECGC